MDDKQFDELLPSIGDMGRHMRGQAVAGNNGGQSPIKSKMIAISACQTGARACFFSKRCGAQA